MCPANCAAGIQRPLGALEFLELPNQVRADVALLHETAWLCENCGSVYVGSPKGMVLLARLPLARHLGFDS
jgi:hypothetical protein